MTLPQRLLVFGLLVLGVAACVQLARARPAREPSRAIALALLLASVVWWRGEGAAEGVTVLAVTQHNGLTVADLVLVPSVAAAAALLVRVRRR